MAAITGTSPFSWDAIEPFPMRVEVQPLIDTAHELCPTPLMRACWDGRVEKVVECLEAGDNLEEKNADGDTALHLAAQRGFAKIAELLIHKDANLVLIGNLKEETALHHAAAYDHFEVAEILCLWGNRSAIDKKTKGGIRAIHLASLVGSYDMVAGLLRYKAKVNRLNDITTPLHYAISGRRNDYLEIVRLLIENGADIRRMNNEGWSAYLLAEFSGDKACLEIFRNNTTAECRNVQENLRREIVIAHFGVSTNTITDHKRVPLLGAATPYMLEVLKNSLESFCGREASLKQRELIIALDEASSKRSPQQIRDSILSDKLTIIPCGWLKHDFCLVVYKNKMAICNAGEGPGFSTIMPFLINRDRFTTEVIQETFEYLSKERAEAEPYYYKSLPKILEGARLPDQFTKAITSAAPHLSTMDNCTLSGSLSAVHCGALFLALENPPLTVSKIAAAQEISKCLTLFKLHANLEQIEQYVAFHCGADQASLPPPQYRLIEEALSKLMSSVDGIAARVGQEELLCSQLKERILKVYPLIATFAQLAGDRKDAEKERKRAAEDPLEGPSPKKRRRT